MQDRKQHWEKVYTHKQPHQVSWTQARPQTSLQFISETHLPLSASIIDIGGGDSRLVDCLLDMGYTDLTVLDISEAAIHRTRARLGHLADQVQWIVADINEFIPQRHYDLWHDRATFHFLTTPHEVANYVTKAAQAVTSFLTIGTFSESGPDKCSGLPVRQYTEQQLTHIMASAFHKLHCTHEDHLTPFDTIQNFLFCNFARVA